MEDTVKQDNNNIVKKPRGFQVHPEFINRNGRPPKEMMMSTLLWETLTAQDNLAVDVIQALIQKAKNGDTKAIELIIERLDGKMPQRNELTGKDGKDLPMPIFGGLSNDVSTNNSDK